ncbi:MAG: response regulator transcription factor [Clostridia bacterium]|nr:response regulator transcription factor [Clostridia bacterium]
MEKILVIEDDETLARGIEFALSRENYQVIIAGNLKEARSLLESQDFTLLLLDVMLPDGSGFDLCKAIRKTSDTPIIFLTACDEEVNIVQGLDLGADDYITKPFRVGELLSRIRAILRRIRSSNKDPKISKHMIVCGDLELNLLERKLIKNKEEILLTSMEFKLISVFMQNPLQVLGRDQILDKLWDMDGEYVDDNTLSVYIRRLREKVEDDPSGPKFIITVRRFGYKWAEKTQ